MLAYFFNHNVRYFTFVIKSVFMMTVCAYEINILPEVILQVKTQFESKSHAITIDGIVMHYYYFFFYFFTE